VATSTEILEDGMTTEEHERARRELGFTKPDDEPRYTETTYKTVDGGEIVIRTSVNLVMRKIFTRPI